MDDTNHPLLWAVGRLLGSVTVGGIMGVQLHYLFRLFGVV